MPEASSPIQPSSTADAGRTRRNRLILASVLVLVVGLTAVQVLIQQLRFPTPIASNILIFGLVNINILLLLLLVLLVFRSLWSQTTRRAGTTSQALQALRGPGNAAPGARICAGWAERPRKV